MITFYGEVTLATLAGYAMAAEVYKETGKQSVSAREAIELVKMQADHGLPGSNRDRAVNSTHGTHGPHGTPNQESSCA